MVGVTKGPKKHAKENKNSISLASIDKRNRSYLDPEDPVLQQSLKRIKQMGQDHVRA